MPKNKETSPQPGDQALINDNGKTIPVIIIKREGRVHYKVRDNYRGQGWDEQKRKYTGVKVPGGWYRGQNYNYKQEFIVHKSQFVGLPS